jgi:CarD family transcriptional regulator, regulator of rRNA transcription
MFKQGDLVFHPRRGAGIVTGIRKLKVSEADEPYYSISLATGEMLLVPVRKDRAAILTTFTAPQAIIDVLAAKPEELVSDYRQRTLSAEEKLGSGDPLLVAEVLRDLAWRQHTARLSNGDLRLMTKAHKLLANALVVKPNLDLRAASQLLDNMVQKTVLSWK